MDELLELIDRVLAEQDAESGLDSLLDEAQDILEDIEADDLNGRIALRFSYEQQHGHSLELEDDPFLML